MAVLTQIQLEGSSTVYDLNDARISATSVATATHFLATNSGVSAINPISAADLASVLGGFRYNAQISSDDDLDDYTTTGAWEILSSVSPDNFVYMGGTSTLLVFGDGYANNTVQILVAATTARIALRIKRGTGAWTQWRELQGSFITA